MTNFLSVYFTERAPAARALWLHNLFSPVVEACQFEQVPPLEVRPTGRWGGWKEPKDNAPDGRVSVSNKLIFWTCEQLLKTYLHEAAHGLLQGKNVLSHGPEFFCLNVILLLRAEQFFLGYALLEMGFYDLQDRPDAWGFDDENWADQVLNWGLSAAMELVKTETESSAEQLSVLVCQRWQDFLQQRHADQVAAEKQSSKQLLLARQQRELLSQINGSRGLWKWLAVAGWLSFLFVCLIVVKVLL